MAKHKGQLVEIKHSHVIAAAVVTFLICIATWTLAFRMIQKDAQRRLAKEKAVAVQKEMPSAAQLEAKPEEELPAPSAPDDAAKLLSEIAVPDESEPLAAARPVQPARDWPEIKASGKLRVAMLPREGPDGISGLIAPEDFERALLSGFARKYGLGVERVIVRRFEDLQEALLGGRCDIIAASYAITPERQRIFAFSKPFRHTVEQIVTASSASGAKDIASLQGKTGVVMPGTTYWDSMNALAATQPGLKFEAAPDDVEPDMLLARVSTGRYAYSIAEDSYIASHQERRNDLQVVYSFPVGKDIAWPLRKEAPAFLALLNSYLAAELQNKASATGRDLASIKKRGYLRILTRNNPYCYFIHKGRAMGFEYEMAAEFAKEQGLVPMMVVPPEWDDMREWLLEGKGDIVAANMTLTPIRAADTLATFSKPYGSFQQMLVGRLSEKPFRSIADLKGRKVAARQSSSYWTTLDALKRAGNDFEIVPAPEDMETGPMLSKVASGEFDLSVADEPILNGEISAGRKVKPLLAISQPQSYVWAMPANTPQLKKAVDDFISRNSRPPKYHSAFFNTVFKKYFQNVSNIITADKELTRGPALKLSPYDEIFKRYAQRYKFDWRLIAAQSFQESRFDPKAVSYLGTQGLLQVLPSTAADMGFSNLGDPETGVHAGSRYLRIQADRLAASSGKIDSYNLLCFALACYNAGYGHVADARLLAEEMKLNPNVWFGNVEEALKRLSDQKVAARTRYGYCKSGETVSYVRDIMARFKHYADIIDRKTPNRAK